MDSSHSGAAPSLVVIANPASGRGRGARLIPAVERALAARALGGRAPVVVHRTTFAGEETVLARRAADAGASTILAIGGDGTWGNTVRGILASNQRPRLALLAAGTGNDLAFTTSLDVHDVQVAITIALGTAERRIDVGEVDGVAFVNCAGFGFDAEVLRRMSRVRWLRGHAVYLVTAARLLLGYRGFDATVRCGDAAPPTGDGDRDEPRAGAVSTGAMQHHLAVVVSNGARFGGGFLIAPEARVDDAVLDVVRIADGSPWRRIAVFAAVTRGRHLGAPEVSHCQVPSVTLTFPSPPLFDADGELHQARSASVTVRCLPGALRLAVPG